MATFHGNSGVVKIATDAVAEVKDFTLTTSIETADDTAMGDTWRSHKTGFKAWSGSLNCWWDDTDTNGQVAMVEGASLTLNLQPEGSTTGDFLYTGTVTITEVTHTQTMEGIIERSFNFIGDGALSLSTV